MSNGERPLQRDSQPDAYQAETAGIFAAKHLGAENAA